MIIGERGKGEKYRIKGRRKKKAREGGGRGER